LAAAASRFQTIHAAHCARDFTARGISKRINYLIKDLNSERRAAGSLRKKELLEVIDLLVKLRADAKRAISNNQIFQFGNEIEASYKLIREKIRH
jgi:hypothetical protein